MFSDIMGPVDKNSCVIFYTFSVVFFILGLLTLIGGIISILKTQTKDINKFYLLLAVIWSSLMNFIVYYAYRILNTICLKVL